jgi:plasmid stability protein
MAILTITLDEEMASALRERAAQEGGRSVASVVREAVKEKLDREGDPDPSANCDLRGKKVVRARDRQPGKGRAA